jgi:ketosteroid isomerase-like protein
MTCESLIKQFWALMARNDFHAVAAVLADDFLLDWPQSGERIRGAHNFAEMNAEYPAQGPWTFRIDALIADATHAVSEVAVSDGVTHGRAISFFTVTGGKISAMREYWPDPFPAPANRAHLVEQNETPPRAARPIA